MMKKLLLLIVLVAGGYGFLPQAGQYPAEAPVVTAADPLARAYENRQSDIQVGGEGIVVKLLPDDNQGSRHQRIILRLPSGQTLLIAHNIDLAPRIEAIAPGDTLAFYGEYEWNAKGGVIHWTHHDPAGRHPDGWLEHQGVRYR